MFIRSIWYCSRLVSTLFVLEICVFVHHFIFHTGVFFRKVTIFLEFSTEIIWKNTSKFTVHSKASHSLRNTWMVSKHARRYRQRCLRGPTKSNERNVTSYLLNVILNLMFFCIFSRKHWLQTKGSPTSRIDKAIFSEMKPIDQHTSRDFSIKQ